MPLFFQTIYILERYRTSHSSSFQNASPYCEGVCLVILLFPIPWSSSDLHIPWSVILQVRRPKSNWRSRHALLRSCNSLCLLEICCEPYITICDTSFGRLHLMFINNFQRSILVPYSSSSPIFLWLPSSSHLTQPVPPPTPMYLRSQSLVTLATN